MKDSNALCPGFRRVDRALFWLPQVEAMMTRGIMKVQAAKALGIRPSRIFSRQDERIGPATSHYRVTACASPSGRSERGVS